MVSPLRTLPCLGALILLFGEVARAQETCSAPPLVITGVATIENGRLVRHREVVMRDGRIQTIGSVGSSERPAGARVIDARGDTLLPGLVDAHAHMYEIGGPSPRAMYEAPRENSFPITGRQLLRSGVTTARVHLFDVVHGPSLKRDAEDDCFPSPRLQIGGPGLGGGQPNVSGAFFTGYRSVEDARAKLTAMRRAGADWVALHNLGRFPRPELEIIAAAARQQGLRIMAEGDPVAHAELALKIGADSIEYLDRSADATYSSDLIGRLKASPAWVVAPVGYYNRSVAVRQRRDARPNPVFFSFMPGGVAEEMRRRWSEWIAQPDPLEERIEQVNRSFQRLTRSGVKMGVGTDCGSPANFQVDAIWWELETRRNLGMSPIAAFEAATSGNATLLRLNGAGQLRPGARADFVLLRGDVRKGALQLDRVRAVGKGGVLFVDEGKWTGR